MSKHITTNHNTFLKKKQNTTRQNKLYLYYFENCGYVNNILPLYTRTFHLISLKNHSQQHLFVIKLYTYFLSALRSKTCGFCSRE